MRKVFITAIILGSMISCKTEGEKSENEAVAQDSVKADEFVYMTEQFADLKIIRYQVSSFDKLSAQQKELAYYLYQVSLSGRDIIYDQNYKHNLVVRKALENVVANYQGDRTTLDWEAFMTYTKRVWFSNGIHHHYSTAKLKPGCSRGFFDTVISETNTQLDGKIVDVLFDDSTDMKRVNLDPEKDLIAGSANNFYEDGITQEEVDQLKYSFLNAKTMSSSADMQMQNTLAMLKLAMGYPMNDPIEVSNTINELLNKESISKGNDIHTNLSYSILEKQVTLFSLNLKNNKFANLPSLNAFFQQSYNAYRNDFGLFNNEKWFSQTLWGLSLNVPVFSGFSRQSKTAQAKIELMDKENQLTQLEQHLLFQELQLRNNVNSAEEKLYLQKENVALASSIYSNSITKQVIGIGNSLEVTQKHSQLMMAQTAYIGSLVDVFNARLAIDKLYNNLLQNK